MSLRLEVLSLKCFINRSEEPVLLVQQWELPGGIRWYCWSQCQAENDVQPHLWELTVQ